VGWEAFLIKIVKGSDACCIDAVEANLFVRMIAMAIMLSKINRFDLYTGENGNLLDICVKKVTT